MSNVQKVQFQPVVSRTALDTAASEALCKFVGRGKRFTSVKALSRRCGVNVRMLEAAKNPDSSDYRPLNRENLFSIMAVAGADFANEILPELVNIAGHDIPKVDCPAPGELVADHAESHFGIAQAAADGIFCFKDRPRLRAIGQNLIEHGLTLVGLGKSARKVAA